MPAKNARELAAWVRAQPAPVDYASPGKGTFQHLCMEWIAHRTGMKLNHVPYHGSAPALADLLGGHVRRMVMPLHVAVPLAADDVPVDRWQICRFTPPSHVLIEVGVAHAGHGGYHADPKVKASSIVVDFITPETETSIWYFWGMARNFNPNDKALTASIREGQGKIFAEDLEMLERQQKNLLAHPERKLLMLNIDSGGVQSRRVLDRILAAERETAAATAAASPATAPAAASA